MIERLGSRVVFENSFVQLSDDDVRFDDGTEGRHAVLSPVPADHTGVVVIARADDRLALVRTYRYPIRAHQWALPRGHGHGPDPLASARAELREEVGAVADSVLILGMVTPDSGLQSSRVAVVLAEITQPVTARTDQAEVSAIRWVTETDLRTMIGDGQIEDAFTLAAWALWAASRGSA